VRHEVLAAVGREEVGALGILGPDHDVADRGDGDRAAPLARGRRGEELGDEPQERERRHAALAATIGVARIPGYPPPRVAPVFAALVDAVHEHLPVAARSPERSK